jgi:octanoyl-[GcvH]:protein N-octanoyltransferase
MAAAPRLVLVRDSFPDRPAFDTAVSRALLQRVAAGEAPHTLRVHRAGPIVAYGRLDARNAGYAEALRASRAAGFEGVERLAGGRAAVYHEGVVGYARQVADPQGPAHTHDRFRETAAMLELALRRLGVDARIGEVPGEYCPGAYSINARGSTKVAGLGQRVIRGAAHMGAVVVAGGSARVRGVLEPVYAALGMEWDPATTGAIDDEVPGVTYEDVERAIVEAHAARFELVEDHLDPETLALAERLEPQHRSPAT